MDFPRDHPQRYELNDEVHARLPQPLVAPVRMSHLALFSGTATDEEQLAPVADLARRFEVAPPALGVNHYAVDMGPFRLTWERHSEFARYTFAVDGVSDDLFAETAIAAVPADWVAALPGQVVMAAHAVLIQSAEMLMDYEAIATRYFGGNTMVGAAIAEGSAIALTDFRIHADGFSRFLVGDRGMTIRQAGRTMQRLMEIDTYRIMALLALPVARDLAPMLTQSERELARITTALADAGEADEALLLDRLTRLEAEIESREADNHYRFSAADAYHKLIMRRIEELREQRIQGLQTFHEFTERRLAPAINTCRAVALRQESLSERLARATQLLSTRVDITREKQNQSLLESMNRRAKLQLRLQETVEGLSVAAVTYYIVSLVGYAAKGLKSFGVGINPDLAIGASIPVVAILVAMGVRQIRKTVIRTKNPPDDEEGWHG
jgi:uncharacterized membrane-anchored protein